MNVSVEALQLYTRCSLAWFYEMRAGVTRPRTPSTLVGKSINAALVQFYTGAAVSLTAAAGQVWRSWCAEWGEPAILGELLRYAKDRAQILKQFERGEYKKPDGGRYTVPQMTSKFRDLMQSRGLTGLGRKLDDFIVLRGFELEALENESDQRVGSALGDAFAEALAGVDRMSSQTAQPLPGKEAVLGLQIPYAADLSPTLRITGTLDMVRLASDSPEKVMVEVHDFEPQAVVRAGQAARDLRVLAAGLARSACDDLRWDSVERVIYRHWLTGETYVFQEVNIGHLLSVVAAAARGLQHQVVAPRALAGYDGCRPCPYRGLCWSDSGWNSLLLLDPGRLESAEQLRSVIGQLKTAVGGDAETRRRLAQALDVLTAEIVRLDPNLSGMLTLTQQAALAVVAEPEEKPA